MNLPWCAESYLGLWCVVAVCIQYLNHEPFDLFITWTQRINGWLEMIPAALFFVTLYISFFQKQGLGKLAKAQWVTDGLKWPQQPCSFSNFIYKFSQEQGLGILKACTQGLVDGLKWSGQPYIFLQLHIYIFFKKSICPQNLKWMVG